MKSIWIFEEYNAGSDRKVITKWIEGKSKEAKAKLDAILRRLVSMPRAAWDRPIFSPLDAEISELRFKASNLQHRVFGYVDSSGSRYVMLIGCTKKQGNYDPRECIPTARARKLAIAAGSANTTIYALKKSAP